MLIRWEHYATNFFGEVTDPVRLSQYPIGYGFISGDAMLKQIILTAILLASVLDGRAWAEYKGLNHAIVSNEGKSNSLDAEL